MHWISTLKRHFKNLCASALSPFKLLFQSDPFGSPDKEKKIRDAFLSADFGPKFTHDLIKHLKQNWDVSSSSSQNIKVLESYLIENLNPKQPILKPLNTRVTKIILFVGVNGSGKTTTLAKLGSHLMKQGHRILLGAGDTFRAAAIEQLTLWSNRLGAPIVAGKMHSDPASVLFDAACCAKRTKSDFLLADTAGRLMQPSLAQELKKIVCVLKRHDPQAPHEIFCVLDATLGQNSLQQVQWFHNAVGITGLILTKLDGTAKGGSIFNIYKTFKLPILYLGLGENLEDLKPFDPEEFVKNLLCGLELS